MTRVACRGLALLLIASVPALAQEVKYEKYKLDNGMIVILHEDHSLPVGAVNLWYRVGSKDEPVRRSGFAHLFEHLMFMGTQRVPGNEFDIIMESGGGSNNASTSSDRTNYFSNGPAELLPTLLWLDADRLEDLGRTMDQEKLDKQRDVVRNERRQSYENRPYGKLELKVPELIFPPGHPYHISVIGTHEDLEAANVTDVKDFFATYYVPNNVALVVAGDFDSAKIKPLIAKLFGGLPRGGDPPHKSSEPVKLDHVVRTTMLDKVQLPMIAMAFHSPAIFKDGDAEMDLLAGVLSEGNTSRLYKRLVYDDKVAVSVSAYQDSSLLGSTFRIDVLANPDSDLDAVERTVDEEVARLLKDGPKPEELERQKSRIELAKLSQLQSIGSKADKLNEYEYFFGEPNSFKRDLDRYRNATVKGVQQWGQKVLTPEARAIVRVLPSEPLREPSPRDEKPASASAGAFDPRPPTAFKLSNGINALLWQKSELPLVAVSLLLKTGSTLDEAGQAGLAMLTSDMLDEGAGDLDALQFSDKLQSLGATFDASADHEFISASLSVLKRNFEPAAGLMADAVQRPRFEPKEWERIKRLHIENLKQQEEDPRAVAPRVAARAFFGENHPYGWPVAGTPETVSKLNVEDLRRMHGLAFRPEFATLLVAGDIAPAEAQSVLEQQFGHWKGESTAAIAAKKFDVPSHDGLRVVIVNRPEAVQTVVQFIMPGPKFTDERRPQYRLLNTLFGGSFTSRLNQNLRENHGYTYGARSRFLMEPSIGYFVAMSSVRADVTGASVEEFLNEIVRIRAGDISEEEAGKARETLRTDVIQSFEGLGGLLGMASELIANGLPFETIARDMAATQKTTIRDLNSLAKPAIPLERGVLVLVGDKHLILEQLQNLNLPQPVEVNVRGEPQG